MIDLLTKLDSWGEGIGEIAGVTREAAAEIRGLRAIVDRLPKTADGVPITPGMLLYEPHSCHVTDVVFGKEWEQRNIYSTRDAAEKARDEK